MDFFRRNPWLAVGVLVIFLAGYSFMFASPRNFSDAVVSIKRGSSASDAAKILSDASIISHPIFLRIVLRLSGTGSSVQAGSYRFEKPENLFIIARRITTGIYGLPSVRITVTEGTSVRTIAARVAGMFPSVSEKEFRAAGEKHEGYLFPDTYFFMISASAESIVAEMRKNFDEKIALLSDEITKSGHSLSDIVIMASLIEKEVRTDASRRMVAGILWNRLAIGMPLQVDAVFGYIFDRDTYSPSLSDLSVDSPYNTYKYKGLPSGPIGNPGIESIKAVLHPTKTDYLYYLTGKDGVMRYAKTFAEHQANRRKYLDI